MKRKKCGKLCRKCAPCRKKYVASYVKKREFNDNFRLVQTHANERGEQ
jgi:hypothetical protein